MAGALHPEAAQRSWKEPEAGSSLAENPPQQVNGMLGESVLLPLKSLPTKTVTRTEWFFQTWSGSEFRIAVFRDGNLEWQNTSDRFGQRLEMAAEATLRIRALEKEDSGVLTALVYLATGEVLEQTFHLSVSEPHPNPQIRAQVTSKTAEACNVTLQCLVPERGAFNISWKSGNELSALEGGSGCYQLSADGTNLSLSWRPNSSDSTFTCLLSSPVDQKNASFDLSSICLSEGNLRPLWFLLPAVLILILAIVACCWKKRLSKRVPEEEEEELQKKRSPPEGDEDQDIPGQCGFCFLPCKKRSSQGAVPMRIPEQIPLVNICMLSCERGEAPPEGGEKQDPDNLSPGLAETPTESMVVFRGVNTGEPGGLKRIRTNSKGA